MNNNDGFSVNVTPKFSSKKLPIKKELSLQNYIFQQFNPNGMLRNVSFGSDNNSIVERGALSPEPYSRHHRKNRSNSTHMWRDHKKSKKSKVKKKSKFSVMSEKLNIHNFSNKKIVIRNDYDRKHSKQFLEEKNKALKPMFLEDEIPLEK